MASFPGLPSLLKANRWRLEFFGDAPNGGTYTIRYLGDKGTLSIIQSDYAVSIDP